MPKYRVNLFYHGSASYDVEAEAEHSAIEEAKRLKDAESAELFFEDRLNLDFTDADVYED